MARGQGPRSAALDLVGRLNRATGKREGGIVGLNSLRVADADRALSELLSGDVAQMQNYLRRKLRDRRFDSVVRSAIREGRSVPAKQARKIIDRLRERSLFQRGETIARTELLPSLHSAQDEGLRQLIDGGKLQASQIKETWDASEDDDTRDSHRAMDGQSVYFGQPFVTGNGHRLRYPGDRSLGAPAEEIINCRCRKVIDIDHLAGIQ